MVGVSYPLVGWWRRRRWYRHDSDLAAFEGLRPIVVVTGATEGIGLAFARVYARAGHDVLLIARDGGALGDAARALSAQCPKVRIETLAVDLTGTDAVATIARGLAAIGAYADLLVNNAGTGLSGRFVLNSPEAIEALLALNVVALTGLCRHVLPGQLLRGRGGIINVASLGGIAPGPQQAVYYASKAFVISFSEALAEETAGRGVHVMALAPGPVETEFHAKMGADGALYRRFLPSLGPDTVAARARVAFAVGQRVAVPGLVDSIVYLCLRYLPHRLLTPIIALLLKPPAN